MCACRAAVAAGEQAPRRAKKRRFLGACVRSSLVIEEPRETALCPHARCYRVVGRATVRFGSESGDTAPVPGSASECKLQDPDTMHSMLSPGLHG